MIFTLLSQLFSQNERRTDKTGRLVGLRIFMARRYSLDPSPEMQPSFVKYCQPNYVLNFDNGTRYSIS
jgi:hypothetical protein